MSTCTCPRIDGYRIRNRSCPTHGAAYTAVLDARPKPPCGWWVGPIPKADNHTCVCNEPHGHALPHRCPCGAWFEGCGQPPRGNVA